MRHLPDLDAAVGCGESGRDNLGCTRLVLTHGVALPRRAIEMAGDEAMLTFLQDWAATHPGYVTEG